MINLRELIKFSNWLENFLSSCWKKLCSEMKDFTQKLWNSCSVKNELKISFFEEICHVALNENESETVNDSLINNDSNSSSSNDFVSAASFTCSASSVAVLKITAHQNERQFRDFERECQSTDHCFINNEIFNSVYDWIDISFKEKKSELNESVKNTEKSESFDFNDSLKINSLLMKNWLQLTALCLSK